MTPPFSSLRLPAALLGLAAVFAFAPSAQAVLVTTWTQTTGTNATGLTTSSPVFGTGATGSGNGAQVYATTPTYTLAAVGDSLVFSGSASFNLSSGAGSDQFRIGLFNTNGSADNTGWLGYFGTNSGIGANPNGRLWERKAGNTAAYFNNASAAADERQAFAGTPPSTASVSTFLSGTYNFSIGVTRTEAGLSVVWSIIGTGGTNYTIGGTYNDTTPLTYTFNRVGLMSGGGLNANQVSFSGLDATFTAAPIPEPSSWAAAAGLAGLVCAAGRRRRRA